VMPLLLRNIWTGALFLFTILTFSTFFISTVVQATVVIGLIGICWAVACWVPFAIIMEFLKELDEDPRPNRGRAGEIAHRARAISSPQIYTVTTNERQPLIRRRTHEEYEAAIEESDPTPPVAGGTVLGIHNLAIVFPQFVIALVSSAIFRAVDAHVDEDPTNDDTYLGKNGVAWVLRFGGLCTLFGAIFARMVPPTRTERDMRRMLAEMKELREENAP